ncbi:MAG: ferrochelatase [Gammaproteobacteria bacterium]|nr:ferrochelatase [Pseudomonadales bacterium]MCP5346899.1 ferrochelatase [Pseudomonadales bacterium]
MRAILLLNLGTPAAPTAKGLREFYRHFFSDPFVFDIPPWARWALRNFIILPFRAPKTARDYEKIWLEGGSPLKVYTDQLKSRLQDAMDPTRGRMRVFIGMGYSEPFITDTMQEIEELGISEILVFPLFPQYSSATTESVLHGVTNAAGRWKEPPRMTVIKDMFSEPAFVRAWTKLIDKYLRQDKPARRVDHVIFSYHGLPEKTITKADKDGVCAFGSCCDEITSRNRYCYRAQCMETTRAIARSMNWTEDFYSIAFQSRFGREPWIQPYLDEYLEELARKGVKRVAVVTPSFISDCLETIHEIGIEYRELFKEKGGDDLVLIPNLNNEEFWFDAVAEIVERHLSRSVFLNPV